MRAAARIGSRVQLRDEAAVATSAKAARVDGEFKTSSDFFGGAFRLGICLKPALDAKMVQTLL